MCSGTGVVQPWKSSLLRPEKNNQKHKHQKLPKQEKKIKNQNLKRRPKNLEKKTLSDYNGDGHRRETGLRREREEKKRLAREQREYTVVTALPLNRQHCERNPHRRRVLSLAISLAQHKTPRHDEEADAFLIHDVLIQMGEYVPC